MFWLENQCKFIIRNDEPSNEFIVNVLNAFKREALHLLPMLSRDGSKMVSLDEARWR